MAPTAARKRLPEPWRSLGVGVSRLGSWLFESLAAYGVSEVGVPIGEEAAPGGQRLTWPAGDDASVRV